MPRTEQTGNVAVTVCTASSSVIPLRQQCGEDFTGQRGKNVRLHAAAEAVGEHDHRRVLPLMADFNMVAAELFARMV